MDDCSVWWEITLLYLFRWNCTWFEQKKPIKVQNFRLSTTHVKFHQISTLIGSLKYIKLQLRSTEELYFMILKIYAKFEEKYDLLFQKWQEFGKVWPEHSKVPKTCTFNLLLLCKIFNVWPKKVQRSYRSWHLRVMQNLKKNGLVVWKVTQGIWKIFTRALESLKIGSLMGSFNPK